MIIILITILARTESRQAPATPALGSICEFSALDQSADAWLESTASAPANVVAVPGMGEQLRIQDQVAQAVFDDGTLADLVPNEKNRAKELIGDYLPDWMSVTMCAPSG